MTNTEKEAAEPETAKDTEPAPENAAEAEKEDAEDSEENKVLKLAGGNFFACFLKGF